MEIVTVNQGEGEAGIQTGGDRTLVEQKPVAKAQEAPETPETPPAEPTEAELEARREEVIASMWGGKKETPATTPPAATPPAAPVTPAATTPPAAPTAAAPAATPPTTEQVIKETASAVAKEVTRAISEQKPATPSAEAPVELEMTPEDQRDLAIIQRMEADNPKLQGKADEFRKFALSRYEYEAKWLRDNPGRTFNPDDAEHEEFYKGQPDIDTDAYEQARIDLMVDRKVEDRLRPIEEEKIIEKAMPVIAQQIQKNVYAVVEGVDPALAALLKNGDSIDLSDARVAKISETDPIAARVLDAMIKTEVLPMVSALERSLLPGKSNQLNPRENPLHAKIASHVLAFESEMKAKPVAEQMRDGKQFITREEYAAREREINRGPGTPQNKAKALNDLNSAYWRPDVDDIETVIVRDVAKRAKEQIKDLDDLAAKKYKGGAPRQAATPTAEPHVPEDPRPAGFIGRQKPPGVPSSSDTVDTTRGGPAGQKSFGEVAVETHWRK